MLAVSSEAGQPGDGNLVVTGTLVCLDASLKETACLAKPQALGLRTASGELYPLRQHENVAALYYEKRLQTRQFRLTLRQDEVSKTYEMVKAQLVRDGKIFDFHYYCDVCNITTHAPGLCMCCRQEMEYREEPAK